MVSFRLNERSLPSWKSSLETIMNEVGRSGGIFTPKLVEMSVLLLVTDRPVMTSFLMAPIDHFVVVLFLKQEMGLEVEPLV